VCPKNKESIRESLIQFRDTLDQLSDDEIVCLDETGFCNIGNAVYGYFPKGKQPMMHNVPQRLKMSLMMTIGNETVINYKLQKEPYNTNYFVEYLQTLLPSLDPRVKVILMDNVAFHKSKRVKDLIEAHNITPLFIPPYSPRCNPIEEVFSEMKRAFRTSQKNGFKEKLMDSIYKIHSYKAIQKHYNHTRQYAQSA
jgi:transposase